ncbi:MAG: hypothetical protein COB85_00915 [Bacteroidetes bacterium]|nr:MAG: hypothetical protein COB85_00915 [Bacteroidota bacterium]
MVIVLCTEADGQSSKSDQINWHGSLSVDGQYSAYAPTFQEIPSSYLFLSSSQTLTVAQIPIQARVFLSSFNSRTMNQLTFSIDHAQMEQSIRKRIDEKANDLKTIPSVNAFDQQINEQHNNANAYEDIYKINNKLEEGKKINPDLLTEYDKTLESQEQLQKYDPNSYGDYEQYVKLKTLDGKDNLRNDMKWLEDNKIVNSYERFWYSFESIQIGTTHPFLSKYVLSSIPVNGYYFSIYNRGLFLAATNGLAVPYQNRLSNPGFTRQVKAYKGGIGNTKTSHLHIIYMNAKDNKIIDSIAAMANSVAGIESGFFLFDKRIAIKLGAYGDVITTDIENSDQFFAPNFDEVVANVKISNWIADEVNSNSTTSYDYAYDFQLKYKGDQGTRAKFGIEHVEPGYQSLGLSYLQRDIHRYRLELSQPLFNRKIRVSAKIRYDQDNLNGAKSNQSTNFNGILKINTAFRGKPKIGIYYMPNIYQSANNESREKFIHQSHNLNILLSHSYNIGRMPSFSNFTATYHNYQIGKYYMHSVSSLLYQQINVNSKIAIGIRAIYRGAPDLYYWSVEPDLLFRFKGMNSITISMRYGSDHLGNEKMGVNASLSLRIIKRIFWRTTLMENYYSTVTGVNDLMIRTSIVARW